MITNPTPRELANEALRALDELKLTPEEHIELLVRHGIIDRSGRVICNKLFNGKPPEKSNATSPPATNDPGNAEESRSVASKQRTDQACIPDVPRRKPAYFSNYPSPREFAEEVARALRETQMSPEEHIEFLVKHGIIDRNGRVICNKLFNGKPAEPSNTTPPAKDDPGKAGR